MAQSDIENRIKGALWGLFVADSLAMPLHWYYNRKNILSDFPDGVKEFEAPPHPHPEAFMIGMTYRPDVDTAKRLGRPYDILHSHARFYETTYSRMEFSLDDREGSHGNAVASEDQRFHYHHGLGAGDNTLGAHLVRVLMRQVCGSGRYDPVAFVESFVKHLATPGSNSDPYTEIYIRRWFENYTAGAGPLDSAEHQRNIWSIGSHGGMIRPMVLSMLFPGNPVSAVASALTHQIITHRSENVAGALTVVVPLLNELIEGADLQKAVESHGSQLRMPVMTGQELFASYRDHNGPGNIPKDEMWHIHMDRLEDRFDPVALSAKPGDENVVMGAFATACYPEHGLPLALFHAWKHAETPFDALVADANAGGDNVHRGMVLGLLAGAAAPEAMRSAAEGLSDVTELEREISDFAALAGKASVY